MPQTDLTISSRLKKLLPPLTADEKKQLAANIKEDGEVTDVILYWNDGTNNVIIDGMHRWPIAQKEGLSYKTKAKKFASYEDAELWILNHQLGRRNLLAPDKIRQVRGELYNRLKTQQGGDHTSQKSTPGAKYQNETLLDAAEEVASKAGVAKSTVKRDGARVEALEKCVSGIQKGVKAGAFKLTDAEVKLVAKLLPGDQTIVATDLRKGLAGSVKEAMKLEGIKQPSTSKKKKKAPPKVLDRKAYYKQWNSAIGPLVRLVDKIASGVGESKSESHTVVQEHLQHATDEMMEWMGVRAE